MEENRMKGQRINPNNLNPMQMNNMTSMMGMMNTMQKIGKSKRKYTINLDKANKKFLSKFVDEIKKQFGGSPIPQGQGVVVFLDYLKTECEKKDKKEVRVSFEELEFLKKMLSDSLRGIENMKFKWYQFPKKIFLNIMLKQYKYLLEEIKK
jgi:hypothetical protein